MHMTDTLLIQDMVYALTESDGILFKAQSSGLYKSNDQGNSWQNALEIFNDEAITITDILSVDGLLIAASKGGIFKSEDTTTWQTIAFRRPVATLSSLLASSEFTKDNTLFAASLEDGVFRSEDRGNSWIAWNIGLFDLNVLSLVCQKSSIYCGTGTGLYMSHTSGRSWQAVKVPFKTDPILCLMSIRDQLYVGTESQGLYCCKENIWEKIELPSDGAINKILSLNESDMLILVDDSIYKMQGSRLEQWQALKGVTSLGLSTTKNVLVGFNDGAIRMVAL
jgi:ligand-binding sensor domain-containing protein